LPDQPIPPNGAPDEAPLVGLFQLTIPARAFAQNWSYSFGFWLSSDADRP